MATASALISNPAIMKGMFATVIASALDRYVMGIESLESNVTFGMVTGASVLIGSYVSSMESINFLGTGSVAGMYSDKTVAHRLVELSVGTGAAYCINNYGLHNDFNPDDFNTRIMILVGTDFLATYATEYMNGQVLSFFV